MKKDIKYFSLRIDSEILRQFKYVAKDDERSLNGMILSLVRRSIAEFEEEHGKIPDGEENN